MSDYDHASPTLTSAPGDAKQKATFAGLILAALGIVGMAASGAYVMAKDYQAHVVWAQKDDSERTAQLEALRAEEARKLGGIAAAMNTVASDASRLEGKAMALPPVATSADGGGVDPLVAEGQALYASKTCIACHSLDGNKGVGPSFKGLWGKEEKLTDGSTVTVDEAYFASSIKDPNAQVVEGYAPAMPPLGLTDEEIAALAAFVKTLP